jgi:uncharacterized membrane protein
MRSVLVLVIGAAWVAVLLPPMLRSRIDGRPGSTVDSFQRRLHTLQRAVPSHQVPRMARPLAGAQRPLQPRSPYAPQGLQRAGRPSTPAYGYDMRGAELQRRPGLERRTSPQRKREQQQQQRHQLARRPAAHRANARQRRQNVLFLLVLGTGLTAVLALSTKAMEMKVLLAVCVCSLIGYVYLLAQIKQNEARRSYDDMWQYAD